MLLNVVPAKKSTVAILKFTYFSTKMLESELIIESETLKKIITTYAKVFSVHRLPFVVSIISIYVILYSKFLNKMRQ